MNNKEFMNHLNEVQKLMDLEKYKEAMILLDKLKEIEKNSNLNYDITHRLFQLDSNSRSLYNQQIILKNLDNISKLNTVEKLTCYLNRTTNNWTFNWTWWDKMIQYKLDRGMNAFTVQYPLGIADFRDPYIENTTRMLWLKNWLEDVEDHLENKSWLNYSYFYFIDEFQMFIPAGYTREDYFERLHPLL